MCSVNSTKSAIKTQADTSRKGRIVAEPKARLSSGVVIDDDVSLSGHVTTNTIIAIDMMQ